MVRGTAAAPLGVVLGHEIADEIAATRTGEKVASIGFGEAKKSHAYVRWGARSDSSSSFRQSFQRLSVRTPVSQQSGSYRVELRIKIRSAPLRGALLKRAAAMR